MTYGKYYNWLKEINDITTTQLKKENKYLDPHQ